MTVEIQQDIPERLPLLDAFLESRTGANEPLQDVTAVLIQHQLGTQVAMVRALMELGLDAARIHFVDIPYTANATVRAELEKLGIPAGNLVVSDYRLTQAYAPYQRRRVQALAGDLLDRDSDDPLLVLDDGSYFVEAASCFARPFRNLRVVEQTTRGLIKMQHDSAVADYASRIPIVDVASSEPKDRWEVPYIGTSVCRALHASLEERIPLDGDDLCLVLGYGRIGRAVATSLRRELGIDAARIRVSDPERSRVRQIVEDGFVPWDRQSDERVRFRLVVGCSGQMSFGVGDRVFLDDGAILASASSGSAELSREQFIELADSSPRDDISLKDPESLASQSVHSPIEMRLVDRDVTFLNGGFPVNFDGQVNCVPPHQIQVTRTLMVGAALQALSTEARGLQPLDPALCDWVDRTYPEISV